MTDTTKPPPPAQRKALADRWEAIDAELETLAGQRAAIGDAAYTERRDKLLGEIDEVEFRLGDDWMGRREREED